MQAQYDPRITPVRRDLAARSAASLVGALASPPRLVDGWRERIVAGVADMRGAPDPGASLTTQALRGELFDVYEIEEGWAWGQLVTDGYVGYLPAAALAPVGPEPTHRVAARATFLYPSPSIKAPALLALPLNARLAVSAVSGDFARIEEEGFVWAAHLAPLDAPARDFVTVAEQFGGTPYLWGGKSPFGVDCSGLTQMALAAAGLSAPRDSDMQEAALGAQVLDAEQAAGDPSSWPAPLRRGDLVFWRGHVGIMRDSRILLHANAHAMAVASEPLAEAIARIAAGSHGTVTGVRRIEGLQAAP